MDGSDYRLHARLGYCLSRLSKLMQTRVETALAAQGVSRLEWCVLSGVGLEGKQTPSELADHIGITRPGTSRLLRAMRRDALIRMVPDGTDGRSRRIELTREGRAKLRRCRPIVDENDRHFASKLSRQDRVALDKALKLLLHGEDIALDRL